MFVEMTKKEAAKLVRQRGHLAAQADKTATALYMGADALERLDRLEAILVEHESRPLKPRTTMVAEEQELGEIRTEETILRFIRTGEEW